MSSSLPSRSTSLEPPPPPESSKSGPEPDVTWGPGGIDDWGWMAWSDPTGDPTTREAS